ncbi:MAG: hypothetical protein WAU45_13660 [Blastocatellia bacterium]
MGEPSKDPMTDKPVTVAVLGMRDHDGVLYVGRNGETDSIWVLYYRPRLNVREIGVTYRIDDHPAVQDTWEVSGRLIRTNNNRALLKAMLAGSRLRIQIADTDTGTMDFKIAGLEHYIARLGLKAF